MKYIAYKLVGLVFFLLVLASCGGGGSEESLPSPIELGTPKILSPHAGAVCEGRAGERAGTYDVLVKSSAVLGADKYVFSLYDSEGKKIKDKESVRPSVSFVEVSEGRAYTVTVKAMNGSDNSPESTRISFSTPGQKVVDYIPVMKSLVYNKDRKSFQILFVDNDAVNGVLTYRVYYSRSRTFEAGETERLNPEDDYTVLYDKSKKAYKPVEVYLYGKTDYPYYRIQVWDVANNMSSYDVHVVSEL